MPNSLKICSYLIITLLIVPANLFSREQVKSHCCCIKSLANVNHQASIRVPCCCKKAVDQALDGEPGNEFCCVTSGPSGSHSTVVAPEIFSFNVGIPFVIMLLDFRNTGPSRVSLLEYASKSSFLPLSPHLLI